MRAPALLIALALASPLGSAFHAECPATTANFTLRVMEGGVYVLGSAVYEETNGHSGLQTGELPEGCAPDTQLL